MAYTSVLLSGLPGCGKSTLSKLLSKELGWELFSVGDLWREQWKMLYPEGEISFEDYWKNTSFEKNREMDMRAKERFKQGNVVADSRYSIHCKDIPSLRVFIDADSETRTLRASNTDRYRGKSVDEIRKILLEREEEEVSKGKILFKDYDENYDYRDPKHYHQILNSQEMSLEWMTKFLKDKILTK